MNKCVCVLNCSVMSDSYVTPWIIVLHKEKSANQYLFSFTNIKN